MNRLMQMLVWIDRVVNVILGGNSRETLSSRAHRMDVKALPRNIALLYCIKY